jgi:Rrf2 family nitric oxide-sensitive transcriptional repressor
MQLTKFTDYSLRVLIAVGAAHGRGVTIADISAQYGISKNHLMKVVQQLGALGYLQTVRGRGGGLRLALHPAEINIGTVVREVEGTFHVVPCFDAARPQVCVIAPACVLKRVLQRALHGFLEVLDEQTLEDLLVPDRQLRALLSGATNATGQAPA